MVGADLEIDRRACNLPARDRKARQQTQEQEKTTRSQQAGADPPPIVCALGSFVHWHHH